MKNANKNCIAKYEKKRPFKENLTKNKKIIYKKTIIINIIVLYIK